MFENSGHIHLYSPCPGVATVFFPIKSLPHSNAQATKFDLAVMFVKVNPGSSFILTFKSSIH